MSLEHADQETLSTMVCMASPDPYSTMLDVATMTGNKSGNQEDGRSS
ncbi:MAG: hypothetical protein ABR986_05985 [Methanomassiliicoccales archaeon]|jgi:hypothetical protein